MERGKEQVINFVKTACHEYFLNRNSDYIMSHRAQYDIIMIGLKNTDWEEDFTIVNEHYKADQLTDTLYYVYTGIQLEYGNLQEQMFVEGTFICGQENQEFIINGIQWSGMEKIVSKEQTASFEEPVYKKVLDLSYDVVFEHNLLENTFVYDSDRFKKLFEVDNYFVAADQWFWHMCTECIHPEDTEYLDIFRGSDIVKRIKNNQSLIESDIRIKNKEKGYIWVKMTIVFIANRALQRLDKIFIMFKDIDEKKRMDLDYITRARTDALTGLYNREYTEILTRRYLSSKSEGMFVIVDIDNFKKVNDTFGHITGNDLLKKVSQNLKRAVGTNDYVGRFGGDEFIVFIKDVTEARIAKERLAHIMDRLKFYYSEEGEDIEIKCSAGAVIATPETKLDALYLQADRNLYDAKNAGKNTYIVTSMFNR